MRGSPLRRAEADRAAVLRALEREELTDGLEEIGDGGVVALDLALQLDELGGEFVVGGEQFAQLDERANDGD